MSEVCFSVKLRVLSLDDLQSSAQGYGFDGPADGVGEMIDAVIFADRPPVETGFEIVSSIVSRDEQQNVFHVGYRLKILDEASFVAEARRRYNSCWGDGDWMPESLGEAGYEILVASNGNPKSPADNGFEIVDRFYCDDLLSHDVLEVLMNDGSSSVVHSAFSI